MNITQTLVTQIHDLVKQIMMDLSYPTNDEAAPTYRFIEMQDMVNLAHQLGGIFSEEHWQFMAACYNVYDHEVWLKKDITPSQLTTILYHELTHSLQDRTATIQMISDDIERQRRGESFCLARLDTASERQAYMVQAVHEVGQDKVFKQIQRCMEDQHLDFISAREYLTDQVIIAIQAVLNKAA